MCAAIQLCGYFNGVGGAMFDLVCRMQGTAASPSTSHTVWPKNRPPNKRSTPLEAGLEGIAGRLG
jgi:hypothetical protein